MNETVITEVTLYSTKVSDKGMIGIASCLLDNKSRIDSISVYLKPDGDIRLLFPNKFLPNGREVNIYYPINTEVYEAIRQAIVTKLESMKESAEEKNNGKKRTHQN